MGILTKYLENRWRVDFNGVNKAERHLELREVAHMERVVEVGIEGEEGLW